MESVKWSGKNKFGTIFDTRSGKIKSRWFRDALLDGASSDATGKLGLHLSICMYALGYYHKGEFLAQEGFSLAAAASYLWHRCSFWGARFRLDHAVAWHPHVSWLTALLLVRRPIRELHVGGLTWQGGWCVYVLWFPGGFMFSILHRRVIFSKHCYPNQVMGWGRRIHIVCTASCFVVLAVWKMSERMILAETLLYSL